MRFLHGGLALDLPEDWSDQSTLLFVGRPQRTTTPTQTEIEMPAESIAIRFLLDAGNDARAIMAREIAALESETEGLEVLEERAFTCGLGTGWSTTLRLPTPSEHLRQIGCCFVLGRVAVLAYASMGEASVGVSEARLKKILESMTAVKPKW